MAVGQQMMEVGEGAAEVAVATGEIETEETVEIAAATEEIGTGREDQRGKDLAAEEAVEEAVEEMEEDLATPMPYHLSQCPHIRGLSPPRSPWRHRRHHHRAHHLRELSRSPQIWKTFTWWVAFDVGIAMDCGDTCTASCTTETCSSMAESSRRPSRTGTSCSSSSKRTNTAS